MFAVVSGCLQPLQITLVWTHKVLCFQDHLCWCVCLGRHYFPKRRLKFCGIIMAIIDDIWSKIKKWHWQVLGLWADLEVCIFKKKPLKVHVTNFTRFLHLRTNIRSVFAVLRNLEVEFRDRIVCGMFLTSSVKKLWHLLTEVQTDLLNSFLGLFFSWQSYYLPLRYFKPTDVFQPSQMTPFLSCALLKDRKPSLLPASFCRFCSK